MSKQNRAAIAELKGRLGTKYVPVDLEPWKSAVIAVFDADEAGRPYSMVPARNPKPLSPAAVRAMAMYDKLATALAKEKG
jgi:hypothetical protein